ncbi:MAG: contractile injection system tape measure protein [Roseobacter sp.]
MAQSAARIATCHADFDVFAPRGPFSAPETLLTTIRQELLPALSDVLDAPEWQEISVTAPLVEIDLGDWPDDPVWADVRRVLSHKLRQALQAHVNLRRQPNSDVADLPSQRSVEQNSLNDPQGIALFANAVGALGTGTDTEAKIDADFEQSLNEFASAAVPTIEENAPVSNARPLADPSQLNGFDVLDPRRLEEAGITTALVSFFEWLNVSTTMPTRAEILAHIAGRSLLQQALAIWQGAHPIAQRRALPLTLPQSTRIQALALRLRTEAERSNLLSQAQNLSDDLADKEKPATDEMRTELDTGFGENDSVTRVELNDNGKTELTHNAVVASDVQAAEIRRAIARLATAFENDGLPEGFAYQQSQRLIGRLVASDLFETSHQKPWSKDAPRRTSDDMVGGSLPRQGHRTKTRFESNEGVQSRSNGSKEVLDLEALQQDEMAAGAQPAKDQLAHTSMEDRKFGDEVSAGQAADLPEDVPRSGFQKPASPLGADGRGTVPLIKATVETPDQSIPNDQLDLLKLANLLGIQGVDHATSPDDLRYTLAHRFAEHPQATFERAHTTPDHLQRLVDLLRVPKVAASVLLSARALEPPQVRKLHNARPHVLNGVVRALTAEDAAKLVNRLLPQAADLLRAQVAALSQGVPDARAVLQNVALVLLAEQAVDFEALRGQQSTNVTAVEGIAQSSDSEAVDPAAADAREEETFEPDPFLAAEAVLERLAGTLGRSANALDMLLLQSGFSIDEVARVLEKHHTAVEALAKGTEIDLDGPEPQDNALRAKTSEVNRSAQRKLPATPQENLYTVSQSTGEQPLTLRSDQMLLDHLNAVARATAGPSENRMVDLLTLLWSLWSPRSENTEALTNHNVEFPPLLAKITAQMTPDAQNPARLNTVLPLLEPDPDKQIYAVRTMLARLMRLNGPDATGLRAEAKMALSQMLIELTAQGSGQSAFPAVPAQSSPQAPIEQTVHTFRRDIANSGSARSEEEILHVTENAGLVMLHPYYTLLFDRLRITHDGQALDPDHLPRALGALHFLAGAAPLSDPLLCVLLGLDAMYPLPDAEPPDGDAEVLMDGLLRSVIERWGKLGATSPDALRQTFIQRTGSLRFNETGAWLRVAPGPFDMLLDSLPWRLSPVAMRWMPLPCFVSWREDDNA